MDRISIKQHAKEQIKGKIFSLLAIYLVIIAASWVIDLILGPIAGIASLLLGGSVTYSMASIYLGIVKKSNVPQVEDLLRGFKGNNYNRNLIAYIRYVAFTFLWGMLFIIPGIIKSISYSQMFFLLAENNRLEPGDAQRKSMEMMEGHKAEYFILILSFIPWFLLCIITLGIAGVYVTPYMEASLAEFHIRLVKENKPTAKIAKAVTAKAEEVKEKITKKSTAKSTAKKSTKKPTKK